MSDKTDYRTLSPVISQTFNQKVYYYREKESTTRERVTNPQKLANLYTLNKEN